MLEAYKEYGVPDLSILVECEVEELNINENLAIEIFDSVKSGLNTLEHAEDMPSWKNQLKGEDVGTSINSNIDILNAATLMGNPNYTLVEIAEITGIHYATIRKISQGAQHKWLADKYPEIWAELQEARDIRESLNRGKHGNKVRSKFTAEALGITYPPVVSPTGDVHNITNLTEFCRLHGLQRSNFRKVLRGKRSVHFGWKVLSDPSIQAVS
jgi:hypothetical protein